MHSIQKEENMDNKAENFEECINRVDEIIAMLCNNETSLKDSMSLYMEAKNRIALANNMLENAEIEIKNLIEHLDTKENHYGGNQ